MKQIILFALICAFSASLSAQSVNRGAWMLGGSLGFESYKANSDAEAVNTLRIAPNVGYYVINNLGIGLNFNFTNTSSDGEGLSTYSIGPFARYYVVGGLFAQLSFRIGDIISDDFDADATATLTPAIGYSIFLNKSIALEPAVYYELGLSDSNKDFKTFGLSIGIQAFLNRD